MSDNIEPRDELRDGEKKGLNIKAEIFDWVQNVTLILVSIVLIFMFAFRLVGVDGESMLPTLEDKDWLIISNMFYEPKQGDIVVLAKDSFLDGKMIVKRIIATEGQEIDIDFSEGIVYIDGKALREPYVADLTHRQSDMIFPVTVPEDSVFVMGDNRNHSSDSRDTRLGMVNKNYIMGRLLLRILPIGSFGPVK